MSRWRLLTGMSTGSHTVPPEWWRCGDEYASFTKFSKSIDRGVTATPVLVVDERRPVVRCEHGVVRRRSRRCVPGCVRAGCTGVARGLHDRAAEPTREADPLAVDVGAGGRATSRVRSGSCGTRCRPVRGSCRRCARSVSRCSSVTSSYGSDLTLQVGRNGCCRRRPARSTARTSTRPASPSFFTHPGPPSRHHDTTALEVPRCGTVPSYRTPSCPVDSGRGRNWWPTRPWRALSTQISAPGRDGAEIGVEADVSGQVRHGFRGSGGGDRSRRASSATGALTCRRLLRHRAWALGSTVSVGKVRRRFAGVGEAHRIDEQLLEPRLGRRLDLLDATHRAFDLGALRGRHERANGTCTRGVADRRDSRRPARRGRGRAPWRTAGRCGRRTHRRGGPSRSRSDRSCRRVRTAGRCRHASAALASWIARTSSWVTLMLSAGSSESPNSRYENVRPSANTRLRLRRAVRADRAVDVDRARRGTARPSPR